MPLIDLDGENSIAEWWSVVQLLLTAVLLSANGVVEANSRWKAYWFGLSALFVLLSMDESAGFHERIMTFLEPYHFTGFFLSSWIIPYGIVCAILAAVCLPFIAALPRGICVRVVIAAGLFAALGMEAIGGYCISSKAPRICYRVEYLLEESGEMIAITFFILTLLMILESRCRTFAIKL